MAGAAIRMVALNLPGFIAGIGSVPNVQLKFMRQELGRGLKRIKKLFIRTQLSGPPGIRLGTNAKKNVRSHASGTTLANLGGFIAGSRLVHVHEKGVTITAKGGGLLYLIDKKKQKILGVAKKVVIPARLRFRQLVRNETPEMLKKVAEEGMRATEVTLRKSLERVASF